MPDWVAVVGLGWLGAAVALVALLQQDRRARHAIGLAATALLLGAGLVAGVAWSAVPAGALAVFCCHRLFTGARPRSRVEVPVVAQSPRKELVDA